MLESIGQSLFFSEHSELKCHSLSFSLFLPEVKPFCCPWTSQEDLEVVIPQPPSASFEFIKHYGRRISRTSDSTLPANSLFFWYSHEARTEKLNTPYNARQNVRSWDREMSQTLSVLWWMRQSSRGDRRQKKNKICVMKGARMKVVFQCWGHSGRQSGSLKKGISGWDGRVSWEGRGIIQCVPMIHVYV